MKFVPDGSSSNGTNTLEDVLKVGNNFILAIAIGDTVGDSYCRFDLSEIIPSDNYFTQLKDKSQIELDHCRCLNKNCKSNTNTTSFSFEGDSNSRWRVKCIDKHGRICSNFQIKDENKQELIELICGPGKRILINARCSYNVKEIMLKEILPALAVKIDKSQCQNIECHYKNPHITFDAKLDTNINWSLLYKKDEQEKEISLESATFIDLSRALRDGSNHPLYLKFNFNATNDILKFNCRYKFQDVIQVDYSILNSYIVICGNQCLDDGCRNDTYKYVFDIQSIDGTSGGYHWWLEFENKLDGKRRMHSLMPEEMANAGNIWDAGKDFILHHSSSKFKGKESVATIVEKNLNSPQPVYEAYEL